MYVLMITPNKFPEGDAGAVRDGYFAKIYQELGYDVFHIGMSEIYKEGVFKNIHHYSIYEPRQTLLEKLCWAIKYNSVLDKIVAEIVRNNGLPSLVHLYSIGINWGIKFAKKHRIPIVNDTVEWYSPCEFKYGKFSYPYIINNLTITTLIRNPIRVIAISTYLEKYFKNKKIETLRVPVIMDYREYNMHERTWSKIRLVYAGSPANKDYLSEIIRSFSSLPKEIRNLFEFNIYGVGREYVETITGTSDYPMEITAHGRVDRTRVIEALSNSDFSILLRPANERYTKAGFPTKSVEAMMNGCAMICNLTSDLGLYLKDGENAIIVENDSVDALVKSFVNISRLTTEDIINIKTNARITAENFFDYSKYKEQIKNFI